MIFTINNIFIDSSIIIEYFKGSKCELLEFLGSSPSYNLVINETVTSEVIYHLIAYNSDTSPLTLKRKGDLKAKIEGIDFKTLLNQFSFINTGLENVGEIIGLMSKYNLLPNDALILHSCHRNGINLLATHDKDFFPPSEALGITAISSIEQLKDEI